MPRIVRVATPEQLRADLARFEREYDMPSARFLRRWNAGELLERTDYFRWVGLCHLAVSMGILTPEPTPGHAIR